MSDIRDGDFHAFPTSSVDGFTQHGMTLRDYFAGHALAGMGTWTPVEPSEWGHRDVVQKMRAEWAYEQADAMLKARGD